MEKVTSIGTVSPQHVAQRAESRSLCRKVTFFAVAFISGLAAFAGFTFKRGNNNDQGLLGTFNNTLPNTCADIMALKSNTSTYQPTVAFPNDGRCLSSLKSCLTDLALITDNNIRDTGLAAFIRRNIGCNHIPSIDPHLLPALKLLSSEKSQEAEKILLDCIFETDLSTTYRKVDQLVMEANIWQNQTHALTFIQDARFSYLSKKKSIQHMLAESNPNLLEIVRLQKSFSPLDMKRKYSQRLNQEYHQMGIEIWKKATATDSTGMAWWVLDGLTPEGSLYKERLERLVSAGRVGFENAYMGVNTAAEHVRDKANRFLDRAAINQVDERLANCDGKGAEDIVWVLDENNRRDHWLFDKLLLFYIRNNNLRQVQAILQKYYNSHRHESPPNVSYETYKLMLKAQIKDGLAASVCLGWSRTSGENWRAFRDFFGMYSHMHETVLDETDTDCEALGITKV